MQFSKQRVRTAFSRSAKTYDDAAILQKEILSRLIDKLNFLRQEKSGSLLDVGCGTGLACKQLTSMVGDENYFAYDFSLAMLKLSISRHEYLNQHAVCGDAEALPYVSNSFDIVFSASTYQWCNEISNALIDSYRVLKNDGLFVFSTFGPDTLNELRESFAKVDNMPHVSNFLDMQTIGDQMLAMGFADTVIESDVITVEYSSPLQLLKDLKATGATNHLQQRSRGLMGKSRIRKMIAEYEELILENNKYPASYEVIYGHGWKKPNLSKHLDANEWHPIKFEQ